MLQTIRKTLRNGAILVVFISIVFAVFGAFFPSKKTSTQPQPVDIVKLNKQRSDAMYAYIQKEGNPAQKLLYESYRGMSCISIGVECNADTIGFGQSILGRMTNVTMYAYSHPPASGINETYMALSNAGFVPKTYAAQGIGFAAIQGFRPIWKVFRDISFSFLVVLMVGISFMIMFRMKMGAQTAISIESALPRIVITLLLITFSYAIAGFLIDLMYVFMGLAINLLCHNDTFCVASEQTSKYMTAGPGAIFDGFFAARPLPPGENDSWFVTIMRPVFDNGVVNFFRTFSRLGTGIMSILPGTIQTLVYILGFGVGFFVIQYFLAILYNSQILHIFNNVQFLANSWGQLPGSVGHLVIGLVAIAIVPFLGLPILIFLVLLATIVGLFFRIYFMLLFTYLRILFYILFAPVYMLLEAVPGQKGFSSWIRNLIGELITFPLIAIFFLVGGIMVNNFQALNNIEYGVTNVWTPPFLSKSLGPGYNVEQEAFLVVAGMGIIFLIPDLVKLVKDSLGVKPAPIKFGLGTFMGGAGAGLALGGGMLGKGLQMSSLLFGSGGDKGLQGIINRQRVFLSGPLNRRVSDDPPSKEDLTLKDQFKYEARKSKEIFEYEHQVDPVTGKKIYATDERGNHRIAKDAEGKNKKKWEQGKATLRYERHLDEEADRRLQEARSRQAILDRQLEEEKSRRAAASGAQPQASEPASESQTQTSSPQSEPSRGEGEPPGERDDSENIS